MSLLNTDICVLMRASELHRARSARRKCRSARVRLEGTTVALRPAAPKGRPNNTQQNRYGCAACRCVSPFGASTKSKPITKEITWSTTRTRHTSIRVTTYAVEQPRLRRLSVPAVTAGHSVWKSSGTGRLVSGLSATADLAGATGDDTAAADRAAAAPATSADPAVATATAAADRPSAGAAVPPDSNDRDAVLPESVGLARWHADCATPDIRQSSWIRDVGDVWFAGPRSSRPRARAA